LSEIGARERKVWADLWALPQAVVWERLGWTYTVARYCRAMVISEEEFKVAMLGEVRQMEDRLGLTPMSMLRLRWEIVSDEVKEQREGKATATVRKRLRAVD
jgi:hypothetical protein